MRVSEIHSLIYLRSLIFSLINVLESGREVTILQDNRCRNKTVILREVQCKYKYLVTLGVGKHL